MRARVPWRSVIVAAGLGVAGSALLGWRKLQLPPSPFSHPVRQGWINPSIVEFPVEAFSLTWFVVVVPPIACVVAALVAVTACLARGQGPRNASVAMYSGAALCVACVGVFGVVIAIDDSVYRLSVGYWLAAVSSSALVSAIVKTSRSQG